MPAQWVRVTPAILSAMAPLPGGNMLMATAAKKHLTLFVRSRRAPGAGSPKVKAAFTGAAHKTLGIMSRSERNVIVASACRGTGDGIYRRKSKARPGSPLYGKVYEVRVK